MMPLHRPQTPSLLQTAAESERLGGEGSLQTSNLLLDTNKGHSCGDIFNSRNRLASCDDRDIAQAQQRTIIFWRSVEHER